MGFVVEQVSGIFFCKPVESRKSGFSPFFTLNMFAIDIDVEAVFYLGLASTSGLIVVVAARCPLAPLLEEKCGASGLALITD